MTQQQIVGSVVTFGIVLLVAGFIYDDQPHKGPTPLSERCADLGGEWIYKSADLLCQQQDGTRLSYDVASDTFVPYGGSAGIVPVAQASTKFRSLVEAACAQDQDPVFSDLPVPMVEIEEPIVDFSTDPEALHHKTRILEDVADGVNFGGKFVVSTWGCGKGCIGSAVIDATNGLIASYGLEASSYAFQPDSLLLKVGREYYIINRHAASLALVKWDDVCAQAQD